MAENGFASVPGHIGRIPNFGKTQVNPMGCVEPPACIQNAMMTKDKKPFTYTPGGLDLSQIKTPSMARRLARQRSQEEHEQAYAQQQQNSYHPGSGGPPPPPPPPQSKIPPPPPPPALVIEAPSKPQKPIAPGERPEIVIPENPIGMLRKTNSPYHWEVEQAEQQRMGPVPKFTEKVPSPLTVRLPNQQPPQNYTHQPQRSNYQNTPDSPIYKPEAQYANQQYSPNINASPPIRETLQRQDSQFNKSPQPFAGQSPISNGSTYSPNPSNNWRQPEKRDSPNVYSSSPQTPPNRGAFSPSTQHSPNTQQFSPNTNYQNQSPSGPSYHTLPRVAQRQPEYSNNNQTNNNTIYNNTRQPSPPKSNVNVAPWRTNTLNRHNSDVGQTNNQQDSYVPTWKLAELNNNANRPNNNIPQKQEEYVPPWVTTKDSNNNKVQQSYTPPWRAQEPEFKVSSPPSNQNTEPRYQTTMSIAMTPRKPTSQPEHNNQPKKEVVYVNQEPIYYAPDSPKSIPPWVKTQKEKTKTPPPAWVQRPLETRTSAPRELVTPPRETEPEWIKKSNELQRGPRDVISPPKYQQPVQPTWSTRPSENRKSIPKDNAPVSQGGRIIPIQMEVSGDQRGQKHPNLRIVIDMNQHPQNPVPTSAPYSQPTQRIMRVLSPQLVRLDDQTTQADLPSLNRNLQNQQESQSKTRIIPIQIEGGSNGGAKQRIYYHHFTTDGPPRQSKAFKVLQIITGTQDMEEIEKKQGFSDL